MDGRTVLLGDWSPVVRDPIDVLRFALAISAAAAAAAGIHAWPVLAATAGTALAIRLLDLPRPFDLTFCLAMALVGWGEAAELYDEFAFFDRIVHFLVPLLGSPVVYVALARAEVLPDPRDETDRHHHAGIFVVTLALGLAIGAAWEILEWTSDAALGSNLVESEGDTAGDLVADAVGALGAGLVLVGWTVRGWGSVRRIPGENRFEDTNA